jgi:peptidoglycan L-alanyl-D-glutamate endopeptidase CwlK
MRWVATFRVGETTRSVEQQRKNIAKGVSWTMRSRHLAAKDGLARAVDLLCLVDGKVTWAWPPYRGLAKMVMQAAKECNVPLEWGGTWSSRVDGPLSKQADGPHFQSSLGGTIHDW